MLCVVVVALSPARDGFPLILLIMAGNTTAAKEQAGKDRGRVLACAQKEQTEADDVAMPTAVTEQTEKFMLARFISSSMNSSVCSFTAAGTAGLPASACSFRVHARAPSRSFPACSSIAAIISTVATAPS